MDLRRLSLFMGLGLASVACQVPVTESFDESFDVAMDLPETCAGAITDQTDRGTTTITLMDAGATCKIGFAWDGEIVDTAELTRRIEEEAGGAVKRVTVQSLSGAVSTINLRNGNGAEVSAPALDAWQLEVDVDGETMFSIDEVNVDGFLAGGPLEISVAQPIVDAFNAAIEAKDVVAGSAAGMMEVPMADFARLAQENGLRIFLRITGEVTVEVEVGSGS